MQPPPELYVYRTCNAFYTCFNQVNFAFMFPLGNFLSWLLCQIPGQQAFNCCSRGAYALFCACHTCHPCRTVLCQCSLLYLRRLLRDPVTRVSHGQYLTRAWHVNCVCFAPCADPEIDLDGTVIVQCILSDKMLPWSFAHLDQCCKHPPRCLAAEMRSADCLCRQRFAGQKPVHSRRQPDRERGRCLGLPYRRNLLCTAGNSPPPTHSEGERKEQNQRKLFGLGDILGPIGLTLQSFKPGKV